MCAYPPPLRMHGLTSGTAAVLAQGGGGTKFWVPPLPPPPAQDALMPDCGVHYLWFAFVCFLIRSHPPPLKTPWGPKQHL